MRVPKDATEDDLASALYALASLAAHHMPRDMSLTAASTLTTLERRGCQRLTDLATLQGVTQPSMTALVRRMEHAGLVERRGDPDDGRVVLVALTAHGTSVVRRRRAAGAAALAQLIDRMPVEDVQRLHHALPAIRRLHRLGQPNPTTPAPRWPGEDR